MSRRDFHVAAAALSMAGASSASAASDVRRIKLAAAQMPSTDGDIDGNLARATVLAKAARADGAELILFPEFMPTGYALNDSIFAAAEPRDGKTARWLAETSRRLRCAIGTSYLENQGEDHFNTFVLAGADGRELGRVRKETPASMEVNFFRGEAGSHMIDTPLGRIGVGICYESYLCATERHFAEGRPDLILLPHSYPDLVATGGFASPPGTYVALHHARRFGVPVMMVNKTGPWNTMTPIGMANGFFPGLSAIVDGDGAVLVSMDEKMGFAAATVTLDPQRKAAPAPGCEGELIEALRNYDWFGKNKG